MSKRTKRVVEVHMDDAEWIARVEKITDPKELLTEMVANWSMIDSDPYYRDISDALFNKAAALAGNKPPIR